MRKKQVFLDIIEDFKRKQKSEQTLVKQKASSGKGGSGEDGGAARKQIF